MCFGWQTGYVWQVCVILLRKIFPEKVLKQTPDSALNWSSDCHITSFHLSETGPCFGGGLYFCDGIQCENFRYVQKEKGLCELVTTN